MLQFFRHFIRILAHLRRDTTRKHRVSHQPLRGIFISQKFHKTIQTQFTHAHGNRVTSPMGRHGSDAQNSLETFLRSQHQRKKISGNEIDTENINVKNSFPIVCRTLRDWLPAGVKMACVVYQDIEATVVFLDSLSKRFDALLICNIACYDGGFD
jgi:hypothetical protein